MCFFFGLTSVVASYTMPLMRKSWTIRLPETLLTWLREQAAKQTILENRNVSMNEYVVGVLEKVKDEEIRRMEQRVWDSLKNERR